MSTGDTLDLSNHMSTACSEDEKRVSAWSNHRSRAVRSTWKNSEGSPAGSNRKPNDAFTVRRSTAGLDASRRARLLWAEDKGGQSSGRRTWSSAELSVDSACCKSALTLA